MRFKGLDLNLLVAFDVFLEMRSVTQAAEKLNLSQPATSAALSRLREYFKDPILVQHGQKMFSTPYADSLLPHVQALLSTARTITSIPSEFDPATSSRIYRIVASDYLIAALLADVSRELSLIAPNIGFELSLPSESSRRKLELGELDLVITPQGVFPENYLNELLYKDSHVLVGCKSNSLFEQAVTKEAFLSASFVSVSLGEANVPSFVESQLSMKRLATKITFAAPSFTVLPWLLVGTSRVNVMPKRLADRMCREFPLTQTELPFELPLMEEAMTYHHSKANDSGLQWLINELKVRAKE